MNYKQIKAIELKNKMRWLAVNQHLSDECGIYILKREENGFKYVYIGQSKHILTRLAQHLSNYQHIDLSLKKHGLWSTNNPTGWQVEQRLCFINELDYYEKLYIKEYANKGYQLRNKTDGGQNEGKQGIADNRPTKCYHDGLLQGRKNAIKEIKHLFDLHLNATTKDGLKRQETALQKFYCILSEVNDNVSNRKL